MRRVSVRGLMIAVAVIGLMMGVWRLRDERRHRLNLAGICGIAEEHTLRMKPGGGNFRLIPEIERLPQRPFPPMSTEAEALLRVRHALYWMELRQKHQLAARYPWLPVPPDPPPPGVIGLVNGHPGRWDEY